MDILTILLFFIYTWGFGYTATKFLKNSENFYERNIIRIGIGLGIVPFFALLINFLHIPLDWRVFFVASLVIPLIDFIKNKKIPSISLKITKSNIYILIALVIFLASSYMYISGAFNYPWLEDDDSWHHANGVKYIAVERDLNAPVDTLMYLNPYPPAYDVFLGILHQTSPSLQWTLKFFNALIISLGILFFYFFAAKFTGNKKKAIFATLVLASVPSYLSHFIWAHSFIVTLFFPAMYCIEMTKKDKNWMYPAALVIATMCITQPSQPLKLAAIFGIYFIIKWISEKKFNVPIFVSIAGGYLLSFFWWFNHWREVFMPRVGENARPSIAALTSNANLFQRAFDFLQKIFPPESGTATRPYSFNEIVFAQHQNMINNPIGIGIFISVLAVLGVILAIITYKKLLSKEKNYFLIVLFWGIFTFLGVNSMTFNLPFGLFAFRFWMLFAIPLSLLAAEGLWLLFSLFKKYKFIIISIVIIGVLLTSAHQKYSVNTAMWPFGLGWQSYEEVMGYVQMQESLPVDTKVFAFTENYFVIGFDMFTCIWCDEFKENEETLFNQTADYTLSWLRSQEYEYLVIDSRTARKYGINETNNKIQTLLDSGSFTITSQQMGLVLMRIL